MLASSADNVRTRAGNRAENFFVGRRLGVEGFRAAASLGPPGALSDKATVEVECMTGNSGVEIASDVY